MDLKSVLIDLNEKELLKIYEALKTGKPDFTKNALRAKIKSTMKGIEYAKRN